MSGKLLATFPRTDRSEVRLSLSAFRGKKTIDLRLFFLTTEGEWLPTKKGVALRPEEVPSLIAELECASRAGGEAWRETE